MVKLFQCLGIEGNYTLRARKSKDTKSIAKSTYKPLEYSKQRRKTLRALKKGFQDKAEATEGKFTQLGIIRGLFFGELTMKFSLCPAVLEFPENSIFDMVDSISSTVSSLFFFGFT